MKRSYSYMFPIYVNQAGYLPNGRKMAVTAEKCDGFIVKNQAGEIVYQGAWASFGLDELSGDTVYQGDFSCVNMPGEYIVECEKGRSARFSISNDAYDQLLYDSLRAFYFLRCGCALEKEHAGPFVHAPCHISEAMEWENHEVKKNVLGGWHDAGDYGRYVTPGAIAVSQLMYAYTLYPKALEKLDLNVPESGSALADILSECRYELDWLLQMQKEDGGVYHKLTTEKHAPFVMPEEDKAQLFLLPVSSMAVADFSAVCAQASRVFKEMDADYAGKLLCAAEKSYIWLKEHPEFVGFKNPEACGTGGYYQRDDLSNRYWAACAMYAATGCQGYLDDVERLGELLHSHMSLGWAEAAGMGVMALLTAPFEVEDRIMAPLKVELIHTAEKYQSIAQNCGYQAAMTERDYCWGSNMPLLHHGMLFALADKVEGKKRFREWMLSQLHVLMGVNAMGISYVTGNGEYAYNYPHLRPADADGIEESIPGMVSGGPNRIPGDPRAKELIRPGTPPMKCFADDVRCYSLNEITIYWNSPLVFVLAAALAE